MTQLYPDNIQGEGIPPGFGPGITEAILVDIYYTNVDYKICYKTP
jgi:hypothetical protein